MRSCCWTARRCWCARASPSPCPPTGTRPAARASTSSTRKSSAGSATSSSSASEGARAPRGPVPAPAADAHQPAAQWSGLSSHPTWGLGKGQAGVGTERALSVNKNTVPRTAWCRRFPARRGGCGAGTGGDGSLQGQRRGALEGLQPVVVFR